MITNQELTDLLTQIITLRQSASQSLDDHELAKMTSPKPSIYEELRQTHLVIKTSLEQAEVAIKRTVQARTQYDRAKPVFDANLAKLQE